MRRNLLWGAGLLCLALACVRLALQPDVAAASSGKIIYSFAGGADGANPESDLIMDAAGNLYGTTHAGGSVGYGTVFELTRTKDGWKHEVLYSFAGGTSDGANPTAGLVFDNAGNLYGTTQGGGPFNCLYGDGHCGTVFKLAPHGNGAWTESILYTFSGSNGDGANPNTDLIFDSKGNLYGTAWSGGQFKGCYVLGCGTVFRLTPNQDGTWAESTIYVFAGPPDGSHPASALVLDVGGNIYGTTSYGGAETCAGGPFRGCGSAYKLAPKSGGGWTENLMYSFHRFQGTARYPSGGFLFDGTGRILGTSVEGGDGDGAFFRLEQTKKGWEQTVLYRFYGNPDGRDPVGRLAIGPDGSVFGATAVGGMDDNHGTVFELVPDRGRWKERVLFNGSSVADYPLAGPILDSHGQVYGTFAGSTYGGNFGAVYEITP